MYAFGHETFYSPAPGTVGSGAAVTFSASTTVPIATWSWSRPMRVIRWGAIITTKAADNASAALKFTGNLWYQANVNTNQVAGSTASITTTGYNASAPPAFYVDTAGGSLTVPNAILTASAGLDIGTVIYHNVWPQATQTGGYYPAADTVLIPPGGVATQFVIYPGQTFAIMSATVGNTAGAGIMFVEVEPQAFVGPSNNNQLAVTGVPSSIYPTPSDPQASLDPVASTAKSGALGILNYVS